MLEFPFSFFQEEVREGFFVSGMMKRAWAAQLEVLDEIDKICKAHNIKWFADWGTLLGAVRHKGFIPWDDDIDISMLRDDYERFLRVAKQELPDGYCVINLHDDDIDEFLIRVTNGNQINLSAEHLEKYHQFPFVAGIDIFPLDYVARDDEVEADRKRIAKLINSVVFQGDDNALNGYEEVISDIENYTGLQIDKTESPRRQMLLAIDALYSMFRQEDADYVAYMPCWILKDTCKFKLSAFQESRLLPFENMYLPVPAQYEDILKEEYGNYMAIVKNGGMHDYPFYAQQEENLINAIAYYPYKYIIPDDLDDRISTYNKEECRDKREIVFIPYRYSTWKSMEKWWKNAMLMENADVHVIPIPYCERNMDGSVGIVHFEDDNFSKMVQVTDFNTYDFEKRHPDVIVFQNPFDGYNYTSCVPPYFYSDKLKTYSEKLIYIPFDEVEDVEEVNEDTINLIRQMCIQPGVVNADCVVVQSEKIRQCYIECLTREAGERTRKIWENKIVFTKDINSVLQC